MLNKGDDPSKGPASAPAEAVGGAVGGHLLHVGLSKTGSKFLQLWFGSHPQLAYSQWGIAGAPDALELIQRVCFGDFKYHVTSCETFTHPIRGYHHFDFRPGVIPRRSSQLKMCRFLAQTFREPKVLIVTRGFRGIIWSTYAEMVRNGASYSFEEFCRWLSRDIDRHRNPLDYDFLLGAYRDAFGADNLIVLPYELLNVDAAEFTRVLERRLGLDPCPPPPMRIHGSFTPQQVYWYPRFARLVKSLPLGRRRRPRLFARYVRAARRGRLDGAVRLLERLRPGGAVTPEQVAYPLLERFRGTAQCLKEDPLYQQFGEEYLF